MKQSRKKRIIGALIAAAVVFGILTSSFYVPLAAAGGFKDNNTSGEDDLIGTKLDNSEIVFDDYTRPSSNAEINAELNTEENLMLDVAYSKILQYNNGTKTSVNTAQVASGIDTVPSKIFTSARLGQNSGLGFISGNVYFDGSTPRNTKNSDGIFADSKNCTDIIYNLGSSSEINSVWIYHHSVNFATYAYQIYIADSEEELFDISSLTAQVINEQNKTRQKINFKKTVEGQYIGIRFLIPVNPSNQTGMSSPVARLSQIAAFGKRGEISVETSTYQKATSALPELTDGRNLVYNREFGKFKQVSDGNEIDSAKGIDWLKKNPKGLTNGIPNSAAMIYNPIYFNSDATPKNVPPYTNSKDYTDLVYYLGGIADVDEVDFYNHSNALYAIYAYQIYFSDSYAMLYNSSNLCYTYQSNGSTLQKFKFSKPISAKYIGIRFLVSVDPSIATDKVALSSRYLRLSQLAVFGTITKESADDLADVDDDTKLPTKYGANLIKPLDGSIMGIINGQITSASFEKTNLIFDGDPSTGTLCGGFKFADWNDGNVIWYDNDNRYLQIQYNLQSTALIKAVYVANHPNEIYRTARFAVFFGNDIDTLYSDENRVEFKNTKKERINLIEFSTPKKAKYFGIRFYNPVSAHDSSMIDASKNSVYMRLNELAVFGNYENSGFEPTVLQTVKDSFTNNDFKKLGTNILKDYTPKYYLNKSLVKVTDNAKQLTDGDITKHNDMSGKLKLASTDGSGSLDIVYNFGETFYNIEKFAYIGASKDYMSNYFTGWYQVYAADDVDNIFESDNMIFEYNWNTDGMSRGHIIDISKNKKLACSFAIRILNPVTTATEYIAARISEIAAYGNKTVLPQYPTNLAVGKPVKVSKLVNGKLTDMTSSWLNAQKAELLTDESTAKSVSFNYTGDIVLYYNLCNDLNINEIKLTGNIKKYKVYAASNYADIWKDGSLQYTVKKSGDSTKLKYAKINARYVKFVIEDYDPSRYISEVSIIGLANRLSVFKKISRDLKGSNVIVSMADKELEKRTFLNLENKNVEGWFDQDTSLPYGLEGGENNKKPLDVNINLGDLKILSKVTMNFKGLQTGYLPKKVEVYASERLDSFDNTSFDMKPIYTFNGYPTNGTLSFKTVPQLARGVLIRFICGDENYDGYDHMCFSLTEITLEGGSVKGTQKDEYNGTLLKFSDKKTGVSAEIVKYDINDIYNDVYRMKIVKSKLSDSDIKALNENSMVALSKQKYSVEFYDVFGNKLEDCGGRTVKISLSYNAKQVSAPVFCQSAGEMEYLESNYDPSGKATIETTKLSNGSYMLAAYSNDIIIPDDNNNNDKNGKNGNDDNTSPDNDYNDTSFSPETGESAALIPILVFTAAGGLAIVFGRKNKTIKR